MSAPSIISDLVERFERNIESYKNNKYNETQVRREFIDPFFKALGWDVGNENGYAEAYKDVIHEFSLKTKDKAEAPDYLFRIGGTKKFFVEAKKPSVNLKEDISPAFQLRRYAWSAKLPLSILTDFEELVIYDCRIQPKKTDKSSIGRIKYFTYKEYVNSWDEIESIFSREAILKGSFDKYAETNKGKRGTAEVDDSFLKEIENWREILARNIALRNETLSNRELNFAVQKTIDRIIFLRIREDRGIEDYGQLMSLQNGVNVYKRLLQIFTRADEKYNSGLFHFEKEKNRTEEPDIITPEISIDDKVLKEIIKNLYYPDSPYEFSVLPSDILGHVYEQFLGKVIRLTAGHRAVVEAKPEVKKAGGVYYTPTYIVDYIVKNTLGKKLEEIEQKHNLFANRSKPDPELKDINRHAEFISASNKKIPNQVLNNILQAVKEASNLKILDPACGSGSFLIGAYQFLLDWHLRIYTSTDLSYAKSLKKDTPLYQTKENEYRLTTTEKKRILLNNIFGVDIDNQAVEVTKLSLLLKVLEGETDESLNTQISFFRQRALPDLSNNIKCGNSLIGPDFYNQTELALDNEERYRINVFDWESEFKEIMSNGGFDVVIGNPPYVQNREKNFPRIVLDYYFAKYLTSEYQINTFGIFLEKGLKLISISGTLCFIVPNYWLSTKYDSKLREFIFLHHHTREILNVYSVFKNATVDTLVITITRKDNAKNCKTSIKSISREINSTAERLNAVMKLDFYYNIEKVINKLNIDKIGFANLLNLNGDKIIGDYIISSFGIKEYQVGKGNPKQTKNDVVGKIFNSKIKIDGSYLPILKARNFNRFHLDNDYEFIKYGKHLAEPRNIDLFKDLRILIPRILGGKRFYGTITDRQFLCNSDVITLKKNNYSEKFPSLYSILGILLSSVSVYYFKSSNINLDRKVFPKINTKTLLSMPLPDISTQPMISIYENLDKQVKIIINLCNQFTNSKTPQEKTALQRQIDATDKQIDQLVYELYGLTEEEIKIVEESVK